MVAKKTQLVYCVCTDHKSGMERTAEMVEQSDSGESPKEYYKCQKMT